MLPTQDTAYVAEGATRTISQYAQQPVISALIGIATAEVQRLENAVFSLLNSMTLAAQPLAGGPWDILDKLGAVVGQPRDGLSDADYLAQIKIRIRVNRSDGLPEDIIQITALLLTGGQYFEWGAAVEEYIGLQSSSVVQALLGFLGQAKPAGVRIDVRYAASSAVWTLKDSVSGTLGTGLEDSVSGAFPNAPVSLQTAPGS